MATASAGQWVKFFNTAGIPSPAAATYAHIFVENRIQTDMLMDLNKEYLREMGVALMGDIIAILRHAKQVNDQTARDRVLSSEVKVPVATVVANTTSSVGTKRLPTKGIGTVRSEIVGKEKPEDDLILPKAPRRVLPEHEGRYKITLPSGTTQRSKEILAKKAMLYADKESIKSGVFDRLSMHDEFDTRQEQQVRMIGFDQKATSTSIFSRLGGKNGNITEISNSVAGILKNSPTKKVPGAVKKSIKPQQKVILVKRIPAKAATMVADEYDAPERMETGEKSVSFSSEDEIVEIAPRRVVVKPRVNLATASVKARLGATSPRISDALHKTRKIVKLKPNIAKKRSPLRHPETALRMKSDDILRRKITPVHKRLDLSTTKSKSSSVSHLANRIGRVSLSRRSAKPSSSSVFDRLGFDGKKY